MVTLSSIFDKDGGRESGLSFPMPQAPSNSIDDLLRQNESSRQKLSEAGYDDPTREVKPSVLERIFGPLDALGTGVRGLVYNAVSDENVDVWGEMGKALKGEDRVEGADILEELGVDNKWGKMLGGFAVDMLLDPLTYITLGYGAAAKAGGKGVLTAAAKYGDDVIDVAKFAGDIGKNADEAADVLRVLKSSGLVDDAGRFVKGAIPSLTREQSQRVMTDLYKQFGKGGVKFAGIPLGGEDLMSKLGYAIKGADVGDKATGLRALPGAKTIEQIFGMGGIPAEYADLTREGNEVLNTVVKAMRSNVGRELKVNQRIAERFGRELTEAIPDETARTWASVAIGRQFGDDAPKLADLVDNARNLYGTDEFAGALDAVAEFRTGLLGRAKENIVTTLRKTAGLTDEQVESALKGIDLYDTRLQELYAAQKERGLLSLGVFGDDAGGYLPGVSTPEMTSAAQDVAGKLGANVDTLRDQTNETLPFLKRGRNVEATKRKEYLTPVDRLLGATRDGDVLDAGIKTELDLSKLGITAQSKQGGRIILKDFENELAQTLGNNEVATRMAKSLEGFFTDDEATKSVLKAIDRVTNWWKRQATVMRFPAFSNRNFLSNKVLMAQNGGLSVAGEAKSVEVLTKMAKYNAGKLDDVARKAFEREIDDYVRHGVLTSFEELSEQVGRSSSGKITKALGDVNTLVENQGRISAYHTFLDKGMGKQAAGEMVNKTLFDYSDEVLSVFERNFIKRITPFYKWCVPSDSEILTREGFKLYNDLRVGDDVLTYSLELDSMEWQPVQEIATFDVDEDIHVFSNKRVKLRYTDGHRWVTQRRNSTVRHTYGTYRYGGEIRVKTAEQINTDDLLLITSEYHGRASVLTPDQARLLGWLVTDGYHRWRGKHLECVLYQSPKKVCFDEVVAVAGGRPRKPHPITGVVCIPILRELVNELKPHFASKDDLPAIVGGLSREAAEAMYDAMLKAEGSVVRRGTNREHTAFTQKPGPVLDSFLMLCALTGRSVSVRERNGISTVIVRKRRVLSVAAGKQERERYTGIVWCPVTPNGTWVMRQDGSVVITGNTKNNLSNQTRILLESPGKSTWLGHIMESGGAAADIDTSNMPEWLRELNPIQTPLMFRGNPVMISTEGLFPQNDLELIGKVVTGEMNANDALSFLSPLLRTPLEIIMNKDVYYDEDLQAYEGEKKRAPGYIEEFGDIANAVPGLREVWGLMTNALGIQERTGKDGEDYYWMDARAVKVMKDALPWMNQVAKYVGGQDPDKTVLDRWSATGVKPIKYDTEQFEQNKAYEDRDALMDALALMRDEQTAKPGLTLKDLFGGQ